jgi:hypothetical protein
VVDQIGVTSFFFSYFPLGPPLRSPPLSYALCLCLFGGRGWLPAARICLRFASLALGERGAAVIGGSQLGEEAKMAHLKRMMGEAIKRNKKKKKQEKRSEIVAGWNGQITQQEHHRMNEDG